MIKHINTPHKLIHYCIHCAMEHEEKDMQDQMQVFLRKEREKMIGIFREVLDDHINGDNSHKDHFINDIINALR